MATENTGSFTIPGESGCEELTLRLAKKWGADVIRDSDGTVLSDEILNAGYGIYSTICIIRDHNEWAAQNRDKLQQTFLMSAPVVSAGETLKINLLRGYFTEQFAINGTEASLQCWQVFDRTANRELPHGSWSYSPETGSVALRGVTPWHRYTVNFLVWRVWEEISMYNHTTNNWDKEHLMQIDPRYPETQAYMLGWMEHWCKTHPDTTVVRFTSMFYNFVWIWGSSERNRSLFTDWGSYDFTVSPLALDQFEKRYGYRMTSEDFINKGKLHATHQPADRRKLDWMDFINAFVTDFGKKLVDITHKYDKLAYVFYDDSWVGVEPYSPRFKEFGFDGIIKCVFSGFEARMCSGVPGVETHELRLHPYLFPVGLGNAPTFMEGGTPTLDAKKYWNSIRRALLRAPIDRIGLGGYLHLTEPFPDFCDYIEKIANEFREIKGLHEAGRPYTLKPKVGILTAWGKFRPWICSGHFHEHPDLDLINVTESLSGSPLDIEFLSFDEIKDGVPAGLDVILNAGASGSAWSGGFHWQDDAVVSALTRWVHEGGAYIGVGEPSALPGYDTFFRMAHVLGVDEDTGERICHGRWAFEAKDEYGVLTPGCHIDGRADIYLTDGEAAVLAQREGAPLITVNQFGSGRGVYLATYRHSPENARMLLNLILTASGEKRNQPYVTANPYTECAWFAGSKTLVVINNSDRAQTATIPTGDGEVTVNLDPYDTIIMKR